MYLNNVCYAFRIVSATDLLCLALVLAALCVVHDEALRFADYWHLLSEIGNTCNCIRPLVRRGRTQMSLEMLTSALIPVTPRARKIFTVVMTIPFLNSCNPYRQGWKLRDGGSKLGQLFMWQIVRVLIMWDECSWIFYVMFVVQGPWQVRSNVTITTCFVYVVVYRAWTRSNRILMNFSLQFMSEWV